VEIKHYKWTLDIDLKGARKGMDADASVVVEFVDYDIEEHDHHGHHHRAYIHKYGSNNDDDDCDDDDDDCDDDEDGCLREFDVSVVLKVTAKVLTDREIMMGTGSVPVNPKG